MDNKRKYNENDYYYSAARVRALENKIIDYDKCGRICEARNVAEMNRLLEEYGIKTGGELESALNGLLSDTFDLLCEMIPDPALLDIQRYPYDCHNIKSAIKCSVRNTDCSRLLYGFGSVPISDITAMAADRKFDKLPRNMAAAAVKALESYEKTLDPQVIDTLIDNACYLDMAEKAKASGVEFLTDMVNLKIDLTNIMTCVRIIRITSARKNVSYLERMLIPSGTLSIDFFKDAYLSGEAELGNKLKTVGYGGILSETETPLNMIEKRCEDHYISYLGKAKQKITGIEILTAYLTAREYEIKNIRIIAAGKSSGLPADIIRERLRVSYV